MGWTDNTPEIDANGDPIYKPKPVVESLVKPEAGAEEGAGPPEAEAIDKPTSAGDAVVEAEDSAVEEVVTVTKSEKM